MLFVAPRVFRGPRVLSCGPGCCMCRWAAARPRAVRAASFARRVVSKPGQALLCPPAPPAPSTPVGPVAVSGQPRPGPATVHRHRSQAQVLWLAYGSARQTARSSETAIAFACACMRGIETAITFAGEKRAILVQFPGAKVSLVSMVAVRGRALVLWVSKSRVGVHCTGLFSPCSAKSAREREKVLPACSKEPKIGVLWRAGRVFSRKCRWWGCVGV